MINYNREITKGTVMLVVIQFLLQTARFIIFIIIIKKDDIPKQKGEIFLESSERYFRKVKRSKAANCYTFFLALFALQTLI